MSFISEKVLCNCSGYRWLINPCEKETGQAEMPRYRGNNSEVQLLWGIDMEYSYYIVLPYDRGFFCLFCFGFFWEMPFTETYSCLSLRNYPPLLFTISVVAAWEIVLYFGNTERVQKELPRTQKQGGGETGTPALPRCRLRKAFVDVAWFQGHLAT